jgi:hypothetical protein
MPHIDPALREHVASLCGTVLGETKPRPMGTCFFVQTANSTGQDFHYLVTAKHVVEQIRNAGGPGYVRMNKGHVGEYNKGVIDFPIPIDTGWLYHTDESVDLAVLPHELSAAMTKQQRGEVGESGEVVGRFLHLKLQSLKQARTLGFPWPPLECEQVMFIAMTTQFQGVKTNLPTFRMGHLALVTDEPIKGYYGLSQYYVIEAQVYPGNSGAPCLVELVDKQTRQGLWFNLGVVVFSYPSEEELKRVRDVQNAYYNLGLSLVVPIEKVVEIVDSEEEKARREKMNGPHPPGATISAGPDEDNGTTSS